MDKTLPPWTLKVVFSVTNPRAGGAAYDIKTAPPFLPPATLRVQIGWDTAAYINTGSAAKGPGFLLLPVYRKWMEPLLTLPPGQPATGGIGAALPIQVDALRNAKACTPADCPGISLPGRFSISSPLPPQATGTGTVGIARLQAHGPRHSRGRQA